MSTQIKCPNCGTEFEPNDAIRDEVEKELRAKVADWQRKKNEEYQAELTKKEQEWQQKLQTERSSLQKQLEEQLTKTIAGDFENKLELLQKSNAENEERLKLARQKEIELLKQQQEFKTKEAELEITIQKKLNTERDKIAEELKQIDAQRSALRENEFQLRLKELETQLEQQKKLAAEMQRKAEQGSMQLQGESQELALEEMLATAFPFDVIQEVGKGVRGADCIQTIRNTLGVACGKIIWESKRAENFSNDWVEKLKADMRGQGADVAILVTRRYPKDMEQFGEKEGIWICNFTEARALASVLRDGIIRIFNAGKSQENKGDKMNMLYAYLTSPEFAEQWKAIREGFLSMKVSIQKERDAMERLWKAREKQLEKVLLNATHIRGSIDGISGLESVDLNLLGYEDEGM
ncbi:DUF2130 domain-containing protein [Niabella soli]|uniref:DUF2130 domain-containing protein n=1 Tax=Niabella soli TaxID=446683 RepID=UPI000249906D|nr:DUF2130 domain-containing protein [Niabella soli]